LRENILCNYFFKVNEAVYSHQPHSKEARHRPSSSKVIDSLLTVEGIDSVDAKYCYTSEALDSRCRDSVEHGAQRGAGSRDSSSLHSRAISDERRRDRKDSLCLRPMPASL
jgi:hypothetical protein